MTSELLATVVSIAQEAGELALRRRREGVTVAATKSSIVDVVTEADREVESLIRARILDLFPDDAILGEEEGAAAGTSGRTWLVDPIDGTVNYLYDIPQWAVSIAVVEGPLAHGAWAALAGCVNNPAAGELYAAARGEGATLNGAPIRVAEPLPLERTLVATGFAYDAARRGVQGEAVARLLTRVRDIRRFGAASLDICAVANGRVDVYAEDGLNPWDYAAGALIAAEAGADVRIGPGTLVPMSEIRVANPDTAARFDPLWTEITGTKRS